ncbi:MAG: hypothetical protein ACYC69_06700 [Thermodesulfovibrionales bacterium]
MKLINVLLVAIILISNFSISGAYDDKYVHPAINESALIQSRVNGYLTSSLGLANGVVGRVHNKEIREWIKEGGKLEDETVCRSRNHFHDPTKKPWDKAGLNSILLNDACKTFAGERYLVDSSIIWSQNKSDNLYSWPRARDYYYDALTGKIKEKREERLAMTFRSVGQVMHLLADASVPEHVRNDIHVFPINGETEIVGPYIRRFLGDITLGTRTYETWAKANVRNLSYTGAQPDVSIWNGAISDKDAPVPINPLWDLNKYQDQNPTSWVPGTADVVGLAEYTNANFFSKDTTPSIFFPDDYPHPSLAETNYYNIQVSDLETIDAEDGKIDSRFYISKYTGVPVKRLAAISYIHFDLLNLNMPVTTGLRPFVLDENCFKEYASLLVPKAVGYDIALLNYFFRGDIRLEYTTDPTPGYVIANKTDEDMDGLFQILYDNKSDQRAGYMSGNFAVKAGKKGDIFNITSPADAKEPGKYTLVFKGTMGNEKGAVAGYVFSRLLEITPPEQFIYSMVDAGKTDPYFRTVRAKVKNASTSEQMGSGTVQAIAKYKMNTYDANFVYSMSEIKAIDLSSNAAVEVEFNFENDPIPLGVTDLYLEIVFKGTIGSETNAVASGVKDISEPTPIDLFNDTDKSCVNGNWYPTAGAIDLMDTSSPKDHIADTWDVNPHILQNIYIKISSMEDPQIASPSLYNAVVPNLDPGQFKRAVYILTDHKFKYSFYSTWRPSPAFIDHWAQTNNVHTFSGTALKDQTDYLSDPAVCGNDPWCYIHRYPVYYSLRGNMMWWAGGVVFINAPYPDNSSCQGY